MNANPPESTVLVANAQRLMSGRNKSEVARKARIERTKLHRFLNGKQMLRADELHRLAEALDVDVAMFYGASSPRPDFQSAFLKSDDFALRISSLLLGSEEAYPVKDTATLIRLLEGVTPDPEAQRIVGDLCEVLQSRALSAFAFLGAWALLWERMNVEEGIQVARALRRIVPNYQELMMRVGTICHLEDRKHLEQVREFLRPIAPEPFYLHAIGHLQYVLSIGLIDQTAGLAHKILEKGRHRSQETVHTRLLAVKKMMDRPDASEFWGKLLTFLDPNIP